MGRSLDLLERGHLRLRRAVNRLRVARWSAWICCISFRAASCPALGLIGLRLKKSSFRFLDPGLHLLHRLLELGEGSLAQHFPALLHGNRIHGLESAA